MTAVIEDFIRNSDNQIKLTLTEDDEAVSGEWTQLDIDIDGALISRDANGDGVTLDTSSGLLTITPADLLSGEKAAIDTLTTDRIHRVQIVVSSVQNDDGAVFGGKGADQIYFRISDKP